MDALQALFDHLKKKGHAQGHFLGMLHILIGRKITKTDGTVVSSGLAWRELAEWLKKVRWDPESVRELGLDPDELPPRDRQRFWFTSISRAEVHSSNAKAAGDRLAESLKPEGYHVSPAPKG